MPVAFQKLVPVKLLDCLSQEALMRLSTQVTERRFVRREVVIAITDGRLHLGPWEHVFYYEFDGRRRKRILVKIIGE